MATQPQTLTISNFGGRLTRILNGDLNSGFAKFNTSFGYDPFSKPMNLTWLGQPSSIVSGGNPTDAILAGETRSDIAYLVGSSRKIYRIQTNTVANPNLDSVLGVGSVAANSPDFAAGADLEFFGTPERLYVSSSTQINSFPMSSVITGEFGGDTVVGGGASNYLQGIYRPLKVFQGNLVFGNGPTIGTIGATNTVTSSVIGMGVGSGGSTQNLYSAINPPLQPILTIKDLDVSPDYNYLLMTASTVPTESLTTITDDRKNAAAGFGNIFQWNGFDAATTAGTQIPSQALTSLQSYMQRNILFSNDPFGTSVGDGVEKILNLPFNKAPLPNATGVNGNFLYWINPEFDDANNKVYASMYYFGKLDQENPAGLYRVLRYQTSLSGGFVYQAPFTLVVNNRYMTVNNAITDIVTFGLGKHYFSTIEINPGTTSTLLHRFTIAPTTAETPQLGVYETQTQLFSKKISVKQLRVYTEPTTTGNGFQVDLIGSDGSVVTNGTFNYSFVAGDSLTRLEGSQQRIDFNPAMGDIYALGIRITNTGTTNMTIKKVEVDIEEAGK